MMKDTLDKMKHWLDSAEEKIVKYLKWSIERKKKLQVVGQLQVA